MFMEYKIAFNVYAISFRRNTFPCDERKKFEIIAFQFEQSSNLRNVELVQSDQILCNRHTASANKRTEDLLCIERENYYWVSLFCPHLRMRARCQSYN